MGKGKIKLHHVTKKQWYLSTLYFPTLYFLSISITSITLFALFFSLKVSKDFGCPPIFFIRKKEVTMTHNTCSSILSPTSENVERDTSNVEYKSEASLLFVSYFHILTFTLSVHYWIPELLWEPNMILLFTYFLIIKWIF